MWKNLNSPTVATVPVEIMFSVGWTGSTPLWGVSTESSKHTYYAPSLALKNVLTFSFFRFSEKQELNVLQSKLLRREKQLQSKTRLYLYMPVHRSTFTRVFIWFYVPAEDCLGFLPRGGVNMAFLSLNIYPDGRFIPSFQLMFTLPFLLQKAFLWI